MSSVNGCFSGVSVKIRDRLRFLPLTGCVLGVVLVVEHFASITVVHVNATALYQELASLFDKHGIPWGNLCSILMDSCAVMRGSKSCLETRIRNDKASHLLGVNGDVCHHTHNYPNKISAPFDNFIEALEAPTWPTSLHEVSMKFTMPERFLSHRWLSCIDVAVSTLRMMDVFIVFFYSNLPAKDKPIYLTNVVVIYKAQRQVTSAYISCGEYMQKKMPLANNILQAASALGPEGWFSPTSSLLN